MPPENDQAALLFEDRLRALGWFIDRRELHTINLTIENDEVTLRARRTSAEGGPIEIHLTAAEMRLLCRDARRRRGSGGQRAASTRPSRLTALRQREAGRAPLSEWVDQNQVLSYQELLRAIGFDLDRAKALGFRLDEYDSGLVLRFSTAESGADVQQVQPLSKEELRVRIAQSLRRRGYRRPVMLGASSVAS